MKRNFSNKNLWSILLVLSLLGLSLVLVLSYGCTPTAQQQAQQISPERQKAIQDSLNKVYIQKLNLYWSTAYEHYKNKMYRNCIKPFWKVVELDTMKRFKNTYTFLSNAYVQLNVADSAQIALEMGIKKFPNNAYLHRNLGYIYAGLGRTEDAIEQYETALSIDSSNVGDWKQIANLYIKNDQPDDAIRAYEKVVELDPKDHDAQRTLSKLYKSCGDADAAIARMEEVKKLDPNNINNLFNLGKEYFNLDNYEKAITNFEALLKIQPDDVLALSYLGASLQNIGKFTRAINIYKEAIKIQPDNKKLYTDIATCYKELGQFATARSYTSKALKIDPKFGLANIVRGEIYEAAVEKCMADRGKDIPEFDDKLVFELAYKEYQKATKDLQYKDMAIAKMKYVQDFIPKKQDRFFHKGQTKAKLKCYKWIY